MLRLNVVLPWSLSLARTLRCTHGRATMLAVLAAMCCATAALAIVPQHAGRSLADATAAYSAKDYRRAATLARIVGDRAGGTEREGARYLEGLALFQAGELEAASTALRTAAASSDRFIAAQAHVTLASIEVERKRWDAAGYAYRRAAALLAPADAKRAHSYAARCFDAAGLTVLANESRVAADEAPIDAPTSKPMTPPAREATNGSVDPPASARPTVTADDKPVVPVNRIGAKPASTSTGSSASTPQFAVQVGAFTSAERASQIAAELRARCVALDIECPRVVTRDESNGALLHVVQFGCFPNRGAANKILLQFPKSGYRVEQYCAAELEAPGKPGASSAAGAPKAGK
jgi:cell division septation protein DedD